MGTTLFEKVDLLKHVFVEMQLSYILYTSVAFPPMPSTVLGSKNI